MWMAVVLLCCGCAHQSPDATAAFRRLQVHEADVARASARLAAATSCSAETEKDEHTLCASGDALCDESAELESRDAKVRCERARDACAAGRARRGALCGAVTP